MKLCVFVTLCVFVSLIVCVAERFGPLTPLWSHGSPRSKVTPSWQGRLSLQRHGLLTGLNKIITLHGSPDRQQIVSLNAFGLGEKTSGLCWCDLKRNSTTISVKLRMCYQIICAMHTVDKHVVLGDTLMVSSPTSWLRARYVYMWGLDSHVYMDVWWKIGLSKKNLMENWSCLHPMLVKNNL